MNRLYPLKFTPIILDKIWGGTRLHNFLNKKTKSDKAGESWEISGVEGNISVVSEGFLKGNNLQELIEIYMGDLVGDHVFEMFGTEFPLLVKFIDANDKLSIQVHPDDILADKRHGSFGKTEMWYVIKAEEDAEITVGFNRKINKEEYLKSLNSKTLENILNVENTTEGDVFFLPAGRVHAIGAGVLLTEIQQTSDLTYRIYDYDRPDDTGKMRELHTDLAVDAIDFKYFESGKTPYLKKLNEFTRLVECNYFTVNLYEIDKTIELDYIRLDSFVILICTEGGFEMKFQDSSEKVMKGDTILIPAVINSIIVTPYSTARFLEVFVP